MLTINTKSAPGSGQSPSSIPKIIITKPTPAAEQLFSKPVVSSNAISASEQPRVNKETNPKGLLEPPREVFGLKKTREPKSTSSLQGHLRIPLPPEPPHPASSAAFTPLSLLSPPTTLHVSSRTFTPSSTTCPVPLSTITKRLLTQPRQGKSSQPHPNVHSDGQPKPKPAEKENSAKEKPVLKPHQDTIAPTSTPIVSIPTRDISPAAVVPVAPIARMMPIVLPLAMLQLGPAIVPAVKVIGDSGGGGEVVVRLSGGDGRKGEGEGNRKRRVEVDVRSSNGAGEVDGKIELEKGEIGAEAEKGTEGQVQKRKKKWATVEKKRKFPERPQCEPLKGPEETQGESSGYIPLNQQLNIRGKNQKKEELTGTPQIRLNEQEKRQRDKDIDAEIARIRDHLSTRVRESEERGNKEKVHLEMSRPRREGIERSGARDRGRERDSDRDRDTEWQRARSWEREWERERGLQREREREKKGMWERDCYRRMGRDMERR